MKIPESQLTLKQKLHEFDVWITPSLQEIQDTKKFEDELTMVDSIISSLGPTTNSFENIEHCRPDAIASTCIDLIEKNIAVIVDVDEKLEASIEVIGSLISLLFMVTGKTDNNLKCQFPVYLSQELLRDEFPQKKSKKGEVYFTSLSLGRTLKSDKIAKLISDVLIWSNIDAGLKPLEKEARWLLTSYISAILKDEASIVQFWALGKSYFNLKENYPGNEKSLLAPSIIFKVRGSVSASGGHIPENLLRDLMNSWGLDSSIDYNNDDVIVDFEDDGEIGNATKTRAYDFVLPYKTEGWEPRLFIQCQFYAGDSGSVSHKVVDQTRASREQTLAKIPDARFIEYLDGAGYYASLNTDLQHMLNMETTHSFIQVRTANVRLRREFQKIGFLTPIEIEHAVMRSDDCSTSSVAVILKEDGYSDKEITRVLTLSQNKGFIELKGSCLSISVDRLAITRRLMILDIVALIGGEITDHSELHGKILISGFGPFYGVQFGLLSKKIDEYAPQANYDRNSFAEDISWLSEKKQILMR
jgi:hypothetical protein